MANTPNPAREPLSGTSPIAGDVARMAERILAVWGLGDVRFGATAMTPVARNTDPETSHEAAQSVRNVTDTHKRIMALFSRFGPMTDSDLWEMWVVNHQPTISQSGLRSRRSELVASGHVVDTGERTKLASGRRAIVWDLNDDFDWSAA